MGETVPVGYRFHPTEEELVGHYLKYKLLGDHSNSSVHNTIAEVEVCKFEPWELPALSKVKSEDPEWFFFSPRELKYKKSSNRYNRTTKTGYWKPTGKDRSIKTRGTDHVIGTKKTLVFYKGHPRRPVRTNWVIHEYHAATVPPDKRIYVLCRLMEKAEKKAEGRTDVLVNEGEPVAADHENQATVHRSPDVYTLPDRNLESVFPEPPQADESDFPSIQFSPFVIEQEQYFQDPSFFDASFGIENNITPFPFDDATEEEVNVDSFMESILVDDGFIREERRHSFVNESTPSLSIRKIHYESSETEAELVSAQFGNILETTSVRNEHVVSSRCQVMKMVKTSQDATYTGPPSFSAETEVNREKKDSASDDNFWGVDTSDDSISNEPSLSVFVSEWVSSPSPPVAIPSTSRRVKTKYQPRSNNSVSQGAASRRSQTQRKLSSKAVSQHEVAKETQMLESNKDQKKAQDARSRKNLETTSKYQSSSVNKKSCFMYHETPSTAQNSNPRSVYLVNVVVGFSLLIVTICDMVSFGKCR